MAPPWVLLRRHVNFIEAESAGGAGKAAATMAKSSGELSLEEIAAALKPDLVFADPPEATSLSMVRYLPEYLMHGVKSGTISSTDKGLVVLYTGVYRPGNGEPLQYGCYLVYDECTRSLSALPQLESLDPPTRRLPSIKCLGVSAAILRCRYGDYILAELATPSHLELPAASLYLLRSSAPIRQFPSSLWSSSLSPVLQWLPERQWKRKEVCLPLPPPPKLCGPTCFFQIDMAFAFEGSVCWVDLLAGVLMCDLFASDGPNFSFVPLPEGCCSYTAKEARLVLMPQEFRSMGCVCGDIKFVALVGYSEGLPNDQVLLKTWTLSPDLKEWKEGPGVLVGDLWESKSFREMELPRGQLLNPVLSMNGDESIYISLYDIDYVATHDYIGHITGYRLLLNGHYVLCLDLLQNKVLYSKKSTTNCLSLLSPSVLASDFSACLGRKDSQRGEEASKVGTAVKRTKY